jgi:hypothetical protein
MKITLENPQSKTFMHPITGIETIREITELNITATVDLPLQKKVRTHTAELGVIFLWEDAAYDAIGQWTDTDVAERIQEIYA